MRAVATDLADVGVEAVFFGGTVVGLHLDRLPAHDEERPTTDVDCVPVAVATASDMRSLEVRLDQAGWKHDLTSQKRNAYARVSPSGVPVDFVPLHTMTPDDPVRCARRVSRGLGEGTSVQVLSGAGMVAAKLAAFWDRGSADPLMSHDLEDLAMLLACCSTLEADLAEESESVVDRVRRGLADILADRFVLEVLEGSFPRGVVSTTVLDRIRLLAR